MMCVECGQEVPALIGGSCPPCYLARHQVVTAPEAVMLEYCAHCLARHVGAHWHDLPPDEDLAWLRAQTAREAMKVDPRIAALDVEAHEEEEDPRNHVVHFRLRGLLEGTPVEATREVKVRVRRGVCDRCSRQAGGYWAALLQLRASERDVTPRELKVAHRAVAEALAAAQEGGNRSAFLQRETPEHGGWDYYLGDIDAGRQAARLAAGRLGAKVQESAKLVGRREGDDVYRVTFLVRIALLAPGDIAETLDGEVLEVQRAAHGKVQGIRLADHRPSRYLESDLRRLGGPEMWEEALIVFADSANVQILDPDTQRAVDLPRFAGTPGEGSLRVLRHREQLWVAPPGSSNSS